MTNCPNCGSPIDIDANKCSYCDTPYFDLACLQLDGTPFIVRLKLHDGSTICQKVAIYSASMDYSQNPVYAQYGNGYMPFQSKPSVSYTLTLHGLGDYKIEK